MQSQIEKRGLARKREKKTREKTSIQKSHILENKYTSKILYVKTRIRAVLPLFRFNANLSDFF